MKVEWEFCNFAWKCPYFGYECNECWKGKAHLKHGIRINMAIASKKRTVIITLFHEFLEYMFLKFHLRTFHKILDAIDKDWTKEKRKRRKPR